MSMRYTGKAWKRMRKASGDTLIEQVRQAKYNEAMSRYRNGDHSMLTRSFLKKNRLALGGEDSEGGLEIIDIRSESANQSSNICHIDKDEFLKLFDKITKSIKST